MDYEVVFESLDALHYYEIVDFLTSRSIEFHKLHEYRLDASMNHDSSGLALIRVPSNNLQSVRDLLNENGLLDFGGKLDRDLAEKSKKDISTFRTELESLMGQKIVSVKYVLANYPDYQFNEYHLIDSGILIEFSNHKFLFWNFKEMDFDFQASFYLPDRFELKLLDQHPKLDNDFEIIEVSDSQEWTSLRSSSIRSIEIFTQDYQYSPEVKSEKLTTEIIIRTDYDVCGIYSVEEPEPEIKGTTKKPSFEIHNGWTLVVFDQNVVKEIGKIRN
ncbi:MAG: hypothetical protein AAGC47_03135 [Bacteroidota bacterium]